MMYCASRYDAIRTALIGANGAPVTVLLNDVYDDGDSGVPIRAAGVVERGMRGSPAMASNGVPTRVPVLPRVTRS
jgi:hypothetical protein